MNTSDDKRRWDTTSIQDLVTVVMSLEYSRLASVLRFAAMKFQPGDKSEQKNICCKTSDDCAIL